MWPAASIQRRATFMRPAASKHRLDDVVVAGAAADVAFQLVPDGRLGRAAAMAVHNIDRRHVHARGAVTALQAVIIAERACMGCSSSPFAMPSMW